jgi:hypothetical protein
MAVDIRAGRRLELPLLGGKLVELAAAHGVPVPVIRIISAVIIGAVLKPYANGGRRPKRLPAAKPRNGTQSWWIHATGSEPHR